MSEPGPPVSEEDLHAYVDGQLEPGRRSAVEEHLRTHPDAAARVAADVSQRSALRAAFAGYARQPLPPRLTLAHLLEERWMRRRTPWRVAAMIALALGVGGAGGWWAGSRPPTGIDALAREAAVNYAVYAVDKRRPVEISAAHQDDMIRWLSNRLNQPVAPPDLTALGYQLLGGRLAASPHGAAALFVYQDALGRRLIIYVRPMAGRHETASIEPVDIGKFDGCAWIDRGVGYSLVAPGSYAELLDLSRQVRQQVRSGG